MKEITTKGGLAALLSIAGFMSESFTPLIFILVLFEVVDYITGLISAIEHGGVSSKAALRGAVKKGCYFFLVGLAFCIDYVVFQVGIEFGVHFTWHGIFGILSVCYLISTEGISILENLQEIGVSVPFLTKILHTFKQKIEQEAENKSNALSEGFLNSENKEG